MPSFDASEVFTNRGRWEKTLTEEEQKWWDWVLDTAEDLQVFPSWANLQRQFRRLFSKDCPTDKVMKRALKQDLWDSGRGEWISDQ